MNGAFGGKAVDGEAPTARKLAYGTLAVASFLLLFVTCVNMPIARRYLSPNSGSDPLQYDQAKDPKSGSKFPIPVSDAFGKAIHPTNNTIVVIAGSCSSCSLNAIDPRKIEPQDQQTYVFAYEMGVKDLPSWAHHLAAGIRVVADDDAGLSRRANAAWKPRFLRLDSDGRLLELSDNFSGTPTYVHFKS